MKDEFGRAFKLSAYFRNLAHPLLYQIDTGISLPNSVMMLTDRLQGPGKRKILARDVSILKGKEIANKANFGNLL